MGEIIYYNDNPNLRYVKVKNVRGEVEYSKNCIRMPDGMLYVKGIDLEFKDGMWVLKAIDELDYELGVKVNNANNLLQGIVEISKKGKEKMGYFSPNPFTNCKVINEAGAIVNCIRYDILPPELYIENTNTGFYQRIDGLSAAQLKALKVRNLLVDGKDLTYNSEDDKERYDQMQELYDKSKIPLDADIKYIGRYLGDITFGIELETINGTLPAHICNKYGIIICKDGSIRDGANRYPPEYVTVKYKGAKGLQSIRNVAKEIAKRSDIDIRCSLHVHIGGIKIDRTLFVSLFKLCHKIQNDVFKMFPVYKRKPDGIKQQNYCQVLPNILSSYGAKNFNKYINDAFADMYAFISGGNKLDRNHNLKKKHNPWGGKKWNIKTRYYWVNFVNPIFGKRKTIEFRLHTPTTNSDKIINWIFICAAIVRFAETRVKDCVQKEPVTFEQVLNWYKDTFNGVYGTKLSERLVDYYKQRVEYFAADAARGDMISANYLLQDAEYKFNAIDINV